MKPNAKQKNVEHDWYLDRAGHLKFKNVNAAPDCGRDHQTTPECERERQREHQTAPECEREHQRRAYTQKLQITRGIWTQLAPVLQACVQNSSKTKRV